MAPCIVPKKHERVNVDKGLVWLGTEFIISRLKTFPKQALVFTCLLYKSFENTVGKGELARDEQFLLFP